MTTAQPYAYLIPEGGAKSFEDRDAAIYAVFVPLFDKWIVEAERIGSRICLTHDGAWINMQCPYSVDEWHETCFETADAAIAAAIAKYDKDGIRNIKIHGCMESYRRWRAEQRGGDPA